MVNIVNIYFRAIIFYNFRRGLTQQQCIDELNSIFDDEAPSSTSVYKWCGEFNRDCSSLQDEFREGRLNSVVVPKTIDDVGHLILHVLGNPSVVICQLTALSQSLTFLMLFVTFTVT